MRTWETQRQAWERIPVDDLGYFDTAELLQMSDRELYAWAYKFEQVRYRGWRNDRGLWREHMGLDREHGRVLDYGCGAGIEAVQYASAGNEVSVADINQGSLDLAARVMEVSGAGAPWSTHLIRQDSPGKLWGAADGQFDLVAMNGVLHHIEDPLPAVAEVHRVLREHGELRVMVYTDMGWRLATGEDPPEDVTDHPLREAFVRWGDAVGDWADWYDADRLEQRFGQLFELREWYYIASVADGLPPGHGRYGIGVMEKR